MKKPINSYEDFIKENFTIDRYSNKITLNWIEDTDVSDNMTPEFKQKVISLFSSQGDTK